MSALPSDRGHLPTVVESEALIAAHADAARKALERLGAADLAEMLGLTG